MFVFLQVHQLYDTVINRILQNAMTSNNLFLQVILPLSLLRCGGLLKGRGRMLVQPVLFTHLKM